MEAYSGCERNHQGSTTRSSRPARRLAARLAQLNVASVSAVCCVTTIARLRDQSRMASLAPSPRRFPAHEQRSLCSRSLVDIPNQPFAVFIGSSFHSMPLCTNAAAHFCDFMYSFPRPRHFVVTHHSSGSHCITSRLIGSCRSDLTLCALRYSPWSVTPNASTLVHVVKSRNLAKSTSEKLP